MYTNVCKHCHKVFHSKIRTWCCKECRSKDDDQLDDIVRYLREYPNSNALQISEELGKGCKKNSGRKPELIQGQYKKSKEIIWQASRLLHLF